MLGACTQAAPRNKGVYLLLDTSGTYNQELKKAEMIILYTLSRLEATDSFAVARIDTGSFSEKDIIAKATFDTRPSQTNAQKRSFQARIEDAFRSVPGSQYTDITGGMIQAAQFLNEAGAGTRTIIIFSDMQEELDKVTQRNFPIDLKNIRVIAVNVVKLKTDNVDPRLYLGRLEAWQKRVEGAGATEWRVINDLERLDRILTRG
jgi:hypothetical protein